MYCIFSLLKVLSTYVCLIHYYYLMKDDMTCFHVFSLNYTSKIVTTMTLQLLDFLKLAIMMHFTTIINYLN